MLFVCYIGITRRTASGCGADQGFGKPVGDIVQRRSYMSQQALLDATQPKGRRYYWKSEYLGAIEPALCTQAIGHAARIASPHSAVLLFPIDGVLKPIPRITPPSATAMPRRS